MKPDTWMPLHVPKYLGDTTHLTRDQHGAYLLLLMAYWMRGGPLIDDDQQLATICKATKSEWKRLRAVIAPFFVITDGQWTQKRANEELRRAREVVAARSEAGSSGGRAKWGSGETAGSATRSQRLKAAREIATHTELEWGLLVAIFGGKCVRCGIDTKCVKDHIVPIYQGGSDGIDNLQPLCPKCNMSKGPECKDWRGDAFADWRERLAKCLADASQTPAPIPSPSQVTTSLRSVVKRATTALPADCPSKEDQEEARKYWLKRGREDLVSRLSDEILAFRDNHESKGSRMVDWSAAWRTWRGNALKFNRKPNGNGSQKLPTAHDSFLAGVGELISEIRGAGGG